MWLDCWSLNNWILLYYTVICTKFQVDNKPSIIIIIIIKAEISKRAKYPDIVRNYKFEPIAIETSGVYGPSTKIIIQEIGNRISQKSGDKREAMWLKQRLSIAIQRGNALSILSLANYMTGYA